MDSYVYTQDIEYVCIIQSADQFFQMERFEIYEALTYGKPSVTSVMMTCQHHSLSCLSERGDTEERKTGIWNTVYTMAKGV